MGLFLSRSNYVGDKWLEIVKKRFYELRDNIYESSLPYKTNSVNIILQNMLTHGSLYFFNKILEF